MGQKSMRMMWGGDAGQFLGNSHLVLGELTFPAVIAVPPTSDFLYVSDSNVNLILRFDLTSEAFSDFASPTTLTPLQ